MMDAAQRPAGVTVVHCDEESSSSESDDEGFTVDVCTLYDDLDDNGGDARTAVEPNRYSNLNRAPPRQPRAQACHSICAAATRRRVQSATDSSMRLQTRRARAGLM